MNEKRVGWIDGVRFFAMAWILFVHFIAVFTTNTNVRFPGTLGLLLFGISGKLAVACFCVIAGYFASKPSDMPFTAYAMRRYLFFALQILLIELLYYLVSIPLPETAYLHRYCPAVGQAPGKVLLDILGDAFLLRAQVLPTYWCVDDFVIGGIVVMGAQKLCSKRPWLVRMAVCLALFVAALALDRLWVAICIMGYFFRLISELRLRFKPVVLTAMLLALPWLIRRGECDTTYLLDGVASVFVLYGISHLPFLQRIIGARPFAYWGAHTLELFLLHVPIYQTLESLLEVLAIHRPSTAVYVLYFLCAVCIVCAATYAWRKMYNRFGQPLIQKLTRGLIW